MLQRRNKQSHFNSSRRRDSYFLSIIQRKSWIGLLFLIMLAALIGGSKIWAWMQKPGTFPITQFQMTGQLTHETPQAVHTIVANNIRGGFFSLDVSAAQATLLSMPWIAQVSFRRVWPNTLVIHINEHEAIARFGKNGVLTTAGQIFYPDIKTIPDDLPILSGPDTQAETVFHFYQTLTVLAKPLGLTIMTLNVNAENSWDLTLSNHIQVILGRIDVLQRFQQFSQIYPKILAASKKTMMLIDLRYPNGVAVQYVENKQ